MKKLILMGALLFLSAGCVTTTGVSVSHVWGNSHPHVAAHTGAYFGGLSYVANPIFYTPYYYKRVYVTQPPPPPPSLARHYYPQPSPPPVNHRYGYGGSHKAVFPSYNNTPRR